MNTRMLCASFMYHNLKLTTNYYYVNQKRFKSRAIKPSMDVNFWTGSASIGRRLYPTLLPSGSVAKRTILAEC